MTRSLHSTVTRPECSLGTKLSSDSARSESRFALIVGVLFYAIALCGVFHHEMWRDEYQAWMIAKSSHSLMELLTNLRYEGAGCLWHLCLFGVTRFTDKLLSMQFLHLTIAACGAYLLARYAPFPRWQKVLLVFGYFSLFEYGVISRGYALGNMLLFSGCASLAWRHKWRNTFALVLFGLAANTSLFAAIIAGALLIGILFGPIVASMMEREKTEPSAKHKEVGTRTTIDALTGVSGVRIAVPLLVFCALATFALFQSYPPMDGFRGDWNVWQQWLGHDPTLERLLRSLSSVLIGYFPLPQPKYGEAFWDSTIFGGTDLTMYYVWASLSMGLFGIFAASLWRSKAAFLAYTIGTTTMITFFHFVLLGTVRHYGQLFILFVCCSWIASLSGLSRLPGLFGTSDLTVESPDRSLAPDRKVLDWCKNVPAVLLSAALVCQLGLAFYALSIDYKRGFSPIVDVARYLKQTGRDRDFIAVIPDWLGVGIAGTLNRSVYELGAGKLSTFTTGGTKKRLSDHREVLIECDKAMAREGLSEMLLVIDTDLKVGIDSLDLIRLKSFHNRIVMAENMVLYLVKKKSSRFY